MLSSYVDGNQMMDSKYMMYSKDIDHYFINRPHQMIRHGLIKKNAAENMDTTGIKNLLNGLFCIKHYNNGTWKTFQVNFGDDESMPSCTCYSWRTFAYPWKHILRYSKSFPHWAGTHYQVSTVTHHT